MECWSDGGRSNTPVLHHSSNPFFLHEMYSTAGRWSRLILSWQPFHVFARAIAFDVEFGAPHVVKFDFDGIAGVHRLQPFVKSSCGDNIARTEADELSEPRDLVRELMRHGTGVVVLPRPLSQRTCSVARCIAKKQS